jgi:hypothetical protein
MRSLIHTFRLIPVYSLPYSGMITGTGSPSKKECGGMSALCSNVATISPSSRHGARYMTNGEQGRRRPVYLLGRIKFPCVKKI